MGLPVVVALVTTGLLAVASAEPREQFVFRLLSVYAAGPDQATAADRDNNDQISDTEFLQSLFFFTDEKRDRRVTQAEFVDGYRRQFGLPSELLVIMFDLLDDLNDDGNTRQDSDVTDKRNNKYFDVFSKMSAGRGIFGKNHQNRGDGVLTQRDVTVRKFVGESKQTNKEAYRKSLMKWVAAAADRLYSINYQPHIPGNPWDMEFDYERWFNNLDRNNDSLVSFKELSDEFRRYSPDGRVKRTRWVSRNVQTYSDREWLATVMFDYWDKNKDLRLDDLDVGLILKEADRNRDTRVTTIEFHRFMEKYNKRARRRLATPVRPVMYDCPSPWWQSFGCRPRVDATRAAMDMDDNYDGWITQGELRKRVAYYDRNGDGYANRIEVMMLESMRYGVPGPVANVMFDVYDRNGDGRYDIRDVQHMLSNGRVLCFCDARRAVVDLVKLADRFRQSPQAQGSAGSLRNAMRWQMKREWQRRRLAERLWHNVWGQGGPGGTCREGDCTGKDWRGGSWYSPFDWRQKNRVPENFLQWSYLHDIPRTISSPQGLGVGSGQFFPGSRPTWWNPQWPQGDNQYGGASPGSRSNPSGGIMGGGMNFPSANPARQFPPGSAMPMPPNFMPNPSKISSRPGNFPPASNSGPFVSGNFPPIMDDNSAEEFWNRLLSGLDNETASDWDPIWMKANMNTLPKVFSKNQNLPQWTQTGTNKRNKPWNRKPDSPSLSEIFRNNGMESNPNFQASDGKEQRENSIGRDRSGGSGRPGGQQRPTSSNSRFRREATETSDSKIPVSPVPLPPSPTTKPMSADVGNSSGVTDIDVNSTISDSNDQLKDQNSTKASNTDQPVNQTTTESDSRDQSTSSDTDEVQGKLNTKDTAEKIGRSSAWLGVPFLASNGMSYDRGPDCDMTEPWVSNDMSDYNLDPRILDQTWQGQQDWSPVTEGLLNTNSRPAIMRDRFQTLPYNYNYRPQWWNMWNTYPSWPLQNGWNSNQMWRNFDGQNAFYPANPGMYSPPTGQDFASPLGSQHNLYKRSTGSQNGNINQDDDKEVSRWMMPGNYERFNPTMWNKFSNYNNRFTYGYQSPWWNMWNGHSSWLQRNGWNSNNMWRNSGGQNSFYPRDWDFNSPSVSPHSGFPMGSQHTLYKRSVDHDKENNAQSKEEQVSMMMNNRHYGPFDPSQLNRFNRYGNQPQWWNMWNNFNTWLQGDGWNSKQTWNNYGDPNFFFPKSPNFYGPSSFQGIDYPRNNQHNLYKRSADDQGRQNNERQDKISRWMQNRQFGRFSSEPWNFNRFSIFNRNGPQTLWWNAYSSFPGTDRWNSNEFWRRNGNINSFPQQSFRPFFQMNIDNYNGPTQVPHAVFRRSTENPNNEKTHSLSRMMGGYGGYRPQWWNNYRYWPGYWNNWNWMWSRYYPFYFSKDNKQLADKEHILTKRSTDLPDDDQVSRMMSGYGSYWPRWWNMWNNYRYWPGYWSNNMRRNNNNQWNNYNQWSNNWQLKNNNQFYPFYFSTDNSADQPVRMKRSTDSADTGAEDQVSRMMGGYGGYWPQWWNMWNSYRYWPGYWNNWNRMWNGHYPFFFSKENKELSDKQHVVSKRSTDQLEGYQVSRMMGGYGGYWPQWWNMWNNYRYWPGYWNNWNWMWSRYYPFYFSKENKEQSDKEHVLTKRSSEGAEDQVSRMMGGYGGYRPQWWNMWNNYRHWPGYWNNNMRWNNNNQWNNYNQWNNNWQWRNNNQFYPYYFSVDNAANTPVRMKRSTDSADTGAQDVSRMMGGYGGYWPQWWNMWNNNRYWPGYWNNNWGWNNNNQWNNYNWQWRNNNQFYPYDFSVDNSANQPARMKRSTDDADPSSEHVSRMMGGYGGYWPQWWNMWNNYRYWPGYWNNWNWMWNSYYPFYFLKEDKQQPDKEHVMSKRSTDHSKDDQVSRMMGGYGGYWPQWWNMRNNYRYWPGYWNNWNWMWSRYYPFYFSKDSKQPADKEHILTKRSTDLPDDDQVSRMMSGYGSYWPRWWNMWNNYRYWPGYWNNNGRWNINNQWNNYNHQQRNKNQFYPYYFSTDNSANQPARMKRSTDDADTGGDVSRMMGGYGSYWPQWWNMWNNYRYWPGYWNNWHWMWSHYYPFHFSKASTQQSDRKHVLNKRSTHMPDDDQVSRMMGGYGSYWPQWWNMWNSYRYWPGYWNNNMRWNINNQWNNYNQWSSNSQWRNNNQFYPFYFSTDNSADQQARMKRSTDDVDNSTEDVSRMMGGYGGYWPQWWNMWNSYRYWPGYWNNWNWMWSRYYPFSFSKENKEQSDKEHVLTKRSTEGAEDQVSRMMGGYGGYWPQWWNMRNNYRYWPGYWNNWNWMWNRYYPYSFSKEDKESSDKEHAVSKRSTDQSGEEHVSRMMDGYSGYWPQQQNTWNSYRYWPSYRNNWNNNWMWNSYSNSNYLHPFFFSQQQNLMNYPHRMKREAVDEDIQDVSRMMSGYGSYWPQWWNMWNNYRYWPGYWNNWNWMWSRYYPFYVSTENNGSSEKQHVVSKRSTDQSEENQVSRMMGGYGGYWPQWWNMWNNRYWPGYWNNNWRWNNNNQWNNYNSQWRNNNQFYPYDFSVDNSANQPARMKRSTDDADPSSDQVSRMMGGYGGYWPQWWNMWNNYRYWPGYWNNNWRWNTNNQWNSYNQQWRSNKQFYPFYFSTDNSAIKPVRMKRSTDDADTGAEVSRMMGGYGSYWPQWWNMWSNYRYWPGYWNNWGNNWMWNSYARLYHYYPFSFSKQENQMNHPSRMKREADDDDIQDVSRMMGGYGGYWPQWWNMWNNYRYWPGSWNNWNWMWSRYYPLHFSREGSKKLSEREHILLKRSTDNSGEDNVSNMMGGYGGYWPQRWNMWNNYRYWPGYWNNWNWMWNNHWWNSHFFAKQEPEMDSSGARVHIITERDTSSPRQHDQIMQDHWGLGCNWNEDHTLGQETMWNSPRQWPQWMWNFFNQVFPYYSEEEQQSLDDKEDITSKQNTDTKNEHLSKLTGDDHVIRKRNTGTPDTQKMSRMMGGYGSYWPQWWNMRNNYRYSPGYWNNWNWMWSRYYPFYVSKENKEQSNREHILSRRSTDMSDDHQPSRMMGGYGGNMPQWWNMWNNNRYWPGYRNNWNWMWNNYNPFSYSEENTEHADKEHVLTKRSSEGAEDQVSRMMGGYGGYWPQWWNMRNNYRNWPGYWNNWYWMWNSHYPFYFSKEDKQSSDKEHVSKRSTDQSGEKHVSRMMGGYEGYWPQWWNMWNNYRYWPGYWNNWNWMWGRYYPFFSREGSKEQSERQHVLSKRSTHSSGEDKVSNMMGGYGGYWPQWWSTWNNYRYWPGYWNSWNWMWNNYSPFHFSRHNKNPEDKEHVLTKRSSDIPDNDQVSRMMGGYGGYWPQWWNMWNNYRYWPGYWNNNWHWMWNNNRYFDNYRPFYFSSEQNHGGPNMRMKRSTTENTEGKDISRMMGGYGGYWPQWWNMWNSYRYWPGYWNNWSWMWNRYYPYYFSHSEEHPEKEHILSKRSPDNSGEDKVSNMMGGYGGYWPQWWNMWNSDRYWPGYWNNWNWMRNTYYPFYFSKQKNKHSDKEHYLSKRSTDQLEGDQVSRMMGGYGGFWPQWWNMWNNYRYWPGYWNNWNWMWSRYYPFSFSKENKEQSDKEHVLTKRSSEGAKDQVSRMMGGYGGYWPQWWNMRNNYRYWPGYWMWNSNSYFRYYYPFYFSGDQNYGSPRMKRSTIDNTKGEDISRMMGGYGGYRPQWWNMWNNYRYWPGYWNSNRDWNSNWGWMHLGNGFPFNSYHHFQSSQYNNGHHSIFKRGASGNKKEEKVAHMMNGYHHSFWHKLQNMWNSDRYRSDYWNNQPSWSNDWNRNRWPWNTRSGQVPPSSSFYQQIGNPDFPPTNSYLQQILNSDNRLNEFPSFHPFDFSHNGKEAFNDLAENHREKRSSESGPPENKTAENSTDTSSANDTESAAEPDVARQMTGYDGSPGNPYQRQWWRLYRSYLDSRPRYWRSSPYFIAYDDPYNGFYRRRYSNRYGRYYFVRYVLPWRVYQYWLWQMWNRMWAQNQNLNQNEYEALWRDFTSRYAPFSYSWGDSVSSSDPDVRQQRTNDVASEKEGENEAQEETANAAEKRTKRTTGGMNYLNRYLYQDRAMFNQWWNNNMYSYNNWPGWNYGMYNRMRGPWNGNNNWMWSNYNRYPFMYSQPSESSNKNPRQETDDSASATNQNTAIATAESSRSKRSTGQQNKDDDIENEDISRWMRIPDQFYSQPVWQQSSWGKQMPRWIGGNRRGFNNFLPSFMNGNDWNSGFMPTNDFNQHFNQDRTWDSINSFSPFSFTESDRETDKQSSHERQERSAEETLQQKSVTDGAEPEVSRWMRGFPSMPVMSSMIYPWPLGMRQAWQYKGYNSQSQWRAWNGWGEGGSWDKWNSAYTSTFPSFPFAFSSSADNAKNENIRQKRSSENSPDLKKSDSEEAPENEPEVSRMGRVFGLARFYPVGWTKYSPSIFKNDRWMRYNWPMFNSYLQTPGGSDWVEKNQFPSGLLWSQKQFYPQWNQYQNMPFWGWKGKGQNAKSRLNPFNNDHVDESVFDPLSSYYFSKKDDVNTNSDEKLENSISDKTLTEDSKTTISQEEKGRSRRSVLTLGKLLSKGQEQPEEREITFQTMLKPNRRFIKRHVQYKVKRFSQEATARLEKRFIKRSPTSTPDPTPTADKSTTSPEVAPKMAMRATAPAQGDSMRDREWGPPRGTGFAPNPVNNPRSPDRNEIPNPGFNPNRDTGQTPGSGRGVDPLGNYGSFEDWNWDQPGWGSNPNWAGGRDRGSQGGGQDIRDKNQDPKGPQDRDNTVTTTTTTTGSQPTSDNPSDSILNGDPQNILSNYNYIDFNNPNYWNQFYNPSSFNSSAGGSLGNASQWENWFGLWAYGPNFWDDMNDLDLWDAPWGSGSWGMGPGGDQWNKNWWGNPSTGFSSALPVEIGWEIFWLGDCDEDWNSRDSGYRSLDTQEWLTPVRLVDVAYGDGFPGYTLDRDCKDCFRPYALFPRRYRDSFRPTRFYFRPSLSRFRPTRYSYRPPRFFRPSARPRGSSGGPWYKRFPGYPWDSYGKAQWRGLPWWGWDPNSFWNPWRYRIQYHNNLDNKVRRSRRAAPPSSGLTNLGATSTTVHKLAPTAATIHTNPGSPGNTPSLPSPFNNQGLVGSKPFPGKLGPPFNPSLVGPYSRNNGGAGWGFGSPPASGRGSSWMGNGLPWWDKNNWHVASAGHGIGRFPDRSNPQDTFNQFPGSRNFPGTLDGASNVPAGLGGARNFPAGLDGPRNFPAGLDGPRNFPARLDGSGNFPAGLDGPRNFPAGLDGPRNFPAGLDGPRNFPAGLDGPRNFPAGLDGPRNFPAGLDGPRNFPAGLDGPRNFPARLGQGRDWRPPLFPQDTRPATPWRGGELFRPPGAGFYPGPLRQEGGEPAGDVEAGRSRGSEPVTPQTPWNPSPWNTRKFDGNDQSSGNKDGNSGPA